MTNQPKEIGLIFRTEMVHAMLEGRKTVTRRIMRPQPPERYVQWHEFMDNLKSPYAPGDVIWVKETWKNNQYPKLIFPSFTRYKADGGNGPWKSSMFMPKAYARLWLPIIDVRPEPLQEIDYKDSIQEGFTSYEPLNCRGLGSIELDAFAVYWDTLVKKPEYKFEANPWVWRIEFKVELR